MKYVFITILTATLTVLAVPQPEALVYVPSDYNGEPMPVLYWLHWYNGSAWDCPHTDLDCIVVAPVFRGEADWKNYDLPGLIQRVEERYPASDRWIEGYSRGAYGAAWHAARRPKLFSKVTAIAGGYPDYPPAPHLRLVAGLRDERWLQDSQRYAEAVGADLELVDSSHDPWEFYGALNVR